jgi:hypothetical protein
MCSHKEDADQLASITGICSTIIQDVVNGDMAMPDCLLRRAARRYSVPEFMFKLADEQSAPQETIEKLENTLIQDRAEKVGSADFRINYQGLEFNLSVYETTSGFVSDLVPQLLTIKIETEDCVDSNLGGIKQTSRGVPRRSGRYPWRSGDNPSIDKVLTGLNCCGDQPEGADERCNECPYKLEDCACSRKLCSDAEELIHDLIQSHDTCQPDTTKS